MCGIAGIASHRGLTPEVRNEVRALCGAMEHRGPDGEGFLDLETVTLGMRRLSIIDLAGGAQPIFNEDGSVGVVCNGEIYNYLELRRELLRSGHRFSTNSDVETIVHLFEDHGESFVEHLRGMFALALVDTKARLLVLCRDRLGEKPLYLHQRGTELVFSSELGALVTAGVVPFSLDPFSVLRYFLFGYLPEPYSMVEQVRKLPAGHILSYSLVNGEMRERAYWDLQEAREVKRPPAVAIREVLEEIGELVVRADVGVAVGLSAGIDSSLVASLCSKHSRSVEALTVGYPGGPWNDERRGARDMARWLGLRHHEREVSAQDAVDAFPRVCFQRDDPIADLAGIGYDALASLAHECGLPVLLLGQGGDELFWGYEWVRRAARASIQLREASSYRWRMLLGSLRPPPLSIAGGFDWIMEVGGARVQWQLQRDGKRFAENELVFYEMASHYRKARKLISKLSPRMAALDRNGGGLAYRFRQTSAEESIPGAITRLIIETYLRENGVAQADRLSMAHGVEVRLPLLDYRLVETVLGLRRAVCDLDLPPKAWLTEASRGLVPEFVTKRRKRGFSPPWRSWVPALFRKYGGELRHGYLVESGILAPHRANELAAVRTAPFIGPRAGALEALTLELWSQGMCAARPGSHH